MWIRIPRVAEFKELKEMWKKELQKNYRLAVAAIKQGTWFCKPYWNLCKDNLKAQGVRWQDLMEAYGMCQYKFLDWIQDRESWDNVLSALEEALNTVVKIKRKT